MKKRPSVGERIFEAVIFLFLYAPIFVLIAFSFNSSSSRTVWAGFTFDWYPKLLADSTIMSSVYTTLLVSLIAAVLATIVGTIAAIGFYSVGRRARAPLLAVNNIPVMNADIVTGVSLCLVFALAGSIFGFGQGFGTLLIAHITFNIPYVVLSVMPKLRSLDRNLIDAAQDLGCTWFGAFRRVVIPQIMPGIVNGAIIAFTMSIDDFIISYFTAGPKVQTLAMTIYAMTKKRVSPKINAISTLLFVSVLALLIIINVREMRQEDKAKRLARSAKL